ncbi:MAG TPA: hypothetical protein VGL81_04040 [Polyangiaceae bacterium]|jgi:hypothetical protein
MPSAPRRAVRRWFGLWTGAIATALLVHACGSRTGLLTTEPFDAASDVTLRDGPLEDARTDAFAPQCRARTCAELGYTCGSNGDGCGDALQCGACPEPEICGVGGFSECGGGQGLGPDGGPLCTPRTCATLGFDCGPASDGCGGVLQCGICQYPDACGGAGVYGHCGNPLPCTNLCLQQVSCEAGTTSVTGTVVAGTLPQYGSPDPIYNAIVYVPNAAVSAFTPGVQCSQCGGEVSGDPLVATQTAPDGTFTLVNVPVGTDIPLVIQLGRWRRQITIPTVAACATTALPQSLTRMPRNQTEGDIPLVAVATGEADQTECVLLKMGIDQAEFTQPTGTGRVQFYVDNGSDLGPGTPPAETLWSNPQALAKYDMVVLPCVGMPVDELPSDQQNLVAYTSSGGRVFATHYSYAWLDDVAPFSSTANWFPSGDPTSPSALVGTIDTTFVEGQSFATWLQDVGALSGPDQISLENVRYDVLGVVPPTNQFIYAPQQVLQLSFFAPVGQPASQQCGRVVFTDFHVSGVANIGDAGLSDDTTFPAECTPTPLTPQERALEFMLFDLASCVPPQPQNCTPLTCAQQHIGCGPAGDGCGGQIACGSCPGKQTCGGGGVYGQCGYPDAGTCVPRTCQELGYDCGANGDGCGNVIDCGTCTPPEICGGGNLPSVCGL